MKRPPVPVRAEIRCRVAHYWCPVCAVEVCAAARSVKVKHATHTMVLLTPKEEPLCKRSGE